VLAKVNKKKRPADMAGRFFFAPALTRASAQFQTVSWIWLSTRRAGGSAGGLF
jgi:hypothetical protein